MFLKSALQLARSRSVLCIPHPGGCRLRLVKMLAMNNEAYDTRGLIRRFETSIKKLLRRTLEGGDVSLITAYFGGKMPFFLISG